MTKRKCCGKIEMSTISTDKQELTKCVEAFFREAFSANQYYLILQQYNELGKEYLSEIKVSSAFYCVVYNSLIEALLMNLAKMYDKNKGSIDIGNLVKMCESNMQLFPENKVDLSIGEEKTEVTFFSQYSVKKCDEWYFRKNEKYKEVIEFNRQFSNSEDVIVQISIKDRFDFYNKKFNSLSKKIKNLRIQRNKIYAHNDKDSFWDPQTVISQNPLNMEDIKELIDYALEISIFLLGKLTNIHHLNEYVNIDDWRSTLSFVRLGKEYQRIKVERIKTKGELLDGESCISGRNEI